MARFYVFKDGQQIGSAATRDNAVQLIRSYQAQEDHYLLRSEYSIICGEEEFISYEKPARRARK